MPILKMLIERVLEEKEGVAEKRKLKRMSTAHWAVPWTVLDAKKKTENDTWALKTFTNFLFSPEYVNIKNVSYWMAYWYGAAPIA